MRKLIYQTLLSIRHPGFITRGLVWLLWPEGRRAYQRMMRGERER